MNGNVVIFPFKESEDIEATLHNNMHAALVTEFQRYCDFIDSTETQSDIRIAKRLGAYKKLQAAQAALNQFMPSN